MVSPSADLHQFASVTEIFPGAREDAGADRADPGDAVEALLRAQHGYRAAVHAVDAARVPSLTDFLG